ncbi:hypothetical protein ABZ357_06160 [Streptomyces sp. NPDC005917]
MGVCLPAVSRASDTGRSTQVPEPRLDLNQVRTTLTRTIDGWKVKGVDAL